ncbi:MAG TPA: polysaccharide biosynthesis tyrosine autokinase [Gemmatimonadaceae bacterium]|nr:polysaccharide biosynthesis tyrosine autokinase [Gemmatimonadaceae bacterium]
MPPASAAGAEDVIDLREVFGVLRRHLRLVLGVSAAVTLLAGWVAFHSQRVFQANAVIRIADTRGAMTAGLDNPIANNPMGMWTDPVLSQIQVLESRAVAAQVIERHPLGLRVITDGIRTSALSDVAIDSTVTRDTLPLEFADSGYTVQRRSGEVYRRYGAPVVVDGVRFAIAERPARRAARVIVVSNESAIDGLMKDLDARARKNTDVIDVSYKTTDPAIAREVVNTAVTAFQEINASTAQQESRRRREFVQEQLAETDSILSTAQTALSDFASNKQVYGSDQKIAAEQTGLMDLDMKRGELAATRRMYQTLLDSLEKAKGQHLTEKLNAVVSSPDVAGNPVVQALYQQLVAYEAARDSLTTGYWGSARTNPDVQRLEVLVASTQERLTGATRSQIEALDARISSLDDLKARTAAELQKLPATQAAEARLTQRVEATRKVADQLREEYQKARIAEAVEAGQVEVVDLAPLPLYPIGRGPLFKTVLGLIVGLMLGTGAAFLKENMNTAIHRRDDIEQVLRVPGLAIIPQILPANGRNGHLRFAGVSMPRLPRRNGARDGGRTALVAATDTRSQGAEAFRTLRTSLIFSQAVQSLRTIVVTSPSPQDGKTTTSANLAVTFAQQGMRVALVDCDLRRARMHQVFNVPREPGLTQAMLGHASMDDILCPTQVDGLTFVPAGALPPNPSELLGGPRMRAVLDALHERFDIVLLDTPPVHVAADSLILGRVADGVLLVLRAGHTEKDSAQDALQRLQNVGARVVGAVLNDPDHKVPQYGGYYYYDYYGDEG